jgi:hypothetical protein
MTDIQGHGLTIRSDKLSGLVDYWQAKRGPRAMPRREEIVPEEIRQHLAYAFLIDVCEDAPRFRFSICGPDVATLFSMDLAGSALEDIDLADEAPEILQDYALAADRRQPLCSRHRFVNRSGRQLDYERVLLPLQDGEGHVRWLLGGLIGTAETAMRRAA